MPTLSLTTGERTELGRLARRTDDADQLRRVNALLAPADGMGPRPSPAPNGWGEPPPRSGSPASRSIGGPTSAPPRRPAPHPAAAVSCGIGSPPGWTS